MARFLLFFVAAYGLWCTTESAKLCVKEIKGSEYNSVAGLREEHASKNEIDGRQITEILTSEGGGHTHRKIMEFYLDYADPQPNKDAHPGNSATHAPPPPKHL